MTKGQWILIYLSRLRVAKWLSVFNDKTLTGLTSDVLKAWALYIQLLLSSIYKHVKKLWAKRMISFVKNGGSCLFIFLAK
jgi:hypothetical protein